MFTCIILDKYLKGFSIASDGRLLKNKEAVYIYLGLFFPRFSWVHPPCRIAYTKGSLIH